MPGKVNPVIAEALNQVCFRLFGNDVTVTYAAEHGQLQLSPFLPGLTTALAPILGYDPAAELAHDAYREGRTVRELLIEGHPEIDPSVVDPVNLVGPLSPPPVE